MIRQAVFSLATLVVVAATTAAAAESPLGVRGSETLAPLSQAWSTAFLGRNPGARFDVAGGGLAAAFTGLAEKRVNLVVAARSMRYKESQPCEAAFGQRPTELKLAVSGVAVYVNDANPVRLATYDELLGIFKGIYKNWKQLGGPDAPILLYGQPANTPAGELFVEEVLNGEPAAPDLKQLPGEEVRRSVAAATNAIGFATLAPIAGARPLTIKRVFSSTPADPSEDTIANRVYPISRFVFGYLDPGARQGQLATYLDWIRGAEGQEVARKNGFYPLPSKWRGTP